MIHKNAIMVSLKYWIERRKERQGAVSGRERENRKWLSATSLSMKEVHFHTIYIAKEKCPFWVFFMIENLLRAHKFWGNI